MEFIIDHAAHVVNRNKTELRFFFIINADSFQCLCTSSSLRYLYDSFVITINFSESPSHYNSYFARVLGTPNYTLKLRSFGGYDRQLVDTHIYSTLIDRVVPYVEDDGVQVTSLKKVGDKLRASIRFNEPVYSLDDYYIDYYGQSVNLKRATITLYPNGNVKYPVTLTYCGGNLTDTLAFEIDYSSAVLPNEKVTYFTYGGGSGKINDFGYRSYKNAHQNAYFTNNSEDLNNLSIKNNISVEADVRVPSVKFDCTTTKSILKQHSVTVTLGDADLKDASMYYSWEETKDELGSAIKEKTLYGAVDIKNTIVGGNFDGNRYLHVYVETKYGIGTYKVYDTALKFDNAPPTVSIEKVEGNYNICKCCCGNCSIINNFYIRLVFCAINCFSWS